MKEQVIMFFFFSYSRVSNPEKGRADDLMYKRLKRNDCYEDNWFK